LTERRTLFLHPPGRWQGIGFRELWGYRSLFSFLLWRNLKVRYAQTVLGVGWAVLQPIATMIVFSVVFGRLIGVPSDGAPYEVFSLAGLAPWGYFAASLTAASNSLGSNTGLITKVYFPRLMIPAAPVISGLVDFSIALFVLLAMGVAFGIIPSPTAAIVVPLLSLIIVATAIGVGCWLAPLNIQYRDVRHLVPFMTQSWLFLSPVAYPMSVIPERYRSLYSLNPLAGVIEGFRAVLLGTQPIPWPAIGVGSATASFLFVSGIYYFRRMEWRFPDVA
jgi:lipopolysaccharide transport system permease protein